MRYIIAISALAGVLLLPQIASTAVLWQDSFDEYPRDMLLEDSPSWDRVDLIPQGESFYIDIVNEGDEDKRIEYNAPGEQTSLYIASGGTVSPEMKVSAHEVWVWGHLNPYFAWYYDIYGGVATRLDAQGNGYVALLEFIQYDLTPDGFVEIGYLSHGYYYRYGGIYTEQYWPENDFEIAIIASGQNPVHIKATFRTSYKYWELSYDDYELCYDGGFGGIYVYFQEAEIDAHVNMDDFTEEEVYANIQPTSLGSIKAIYH